MSFLPGTASLVKEIDSKSLFYFLPFHFALKVCYVELNASVYFIGNLSILALIDSFGCFRLNFRIPSHLFASY